MHELDIRVSKGINEWAFEVDIIKQHICLDSLVHACQYYEVKKWCNNTKLDNGHNKLTYEAVSMKAKEHEVAVRECI